MNCNEIMQITKKRIHVSYLKHNLFFVLSAVCFALLIFQFAPIWALLAVIPLAIAGLLSVLYSSVFAQWKKSGSAFSILSGICTIVSLFFFGLNFRSVWMESNWITKLAQITHLSNGNILTALMCVLDIFSSAFIFVTFKFLLVECWNMLMETIRFTDRKSICANLKRNILWIVSAFAFMVLNLEPGKRHAVAFCISCILIVGIFSQLTEITAKLKQTPFVVNLISAVSTVGICWFTRLVYEEHAPFSFLRRSLPSHYEALSFWLGTVLAVAASFAVFVFVSFLLNYVTNRLKPLFRSTSKPEAAVFALLIVLLCVFSCYSFMHSNAFWGKDHDLDILYTSDTSFLVEQNVYLRLYSRQNDLKQALFAVFSAPFIGFGYTVSLPFARFSPAIMPLFMNIIQIIMLVTSQLMIAKMLHVRKIESIVFMLASSVTYSALLFSVMMEQYIIGLFWVIFVIYSYVENKKASALSLTAACGTYITGVILFPLSYEWHRFNRDKSFEPVMTTLKKTVFYFLVVFLAFGRADALLNFFDDVKILSAFVGGYRITERINQYTDFVFSVFFAPDTVVDTTTFQYASLQLSKAVISGINVFGIIILILCAVSFAVNRKNVLTGISAVWICFSAFVMVVVGWGSSENGMILYALYFGWAFLILLFQLFIWISEKLHCRFLTPLLGGVLCIILCRYNYQGIRDLLDFAVTYYPLGS